MAAQAVVAPVHGVENQQPFRENLNVRIICPDCRQDPPDLVENNADTTCGNCGLVLAERLVSYESEWRTFNSDEGKGDDPNRVGEAESDLFFSHQGTIIGGSGPNMSKETRKLKKAQASQNEEKNNRVLLTAYSQIDAWAEKDHLPGPVRNTAKGLYKDIYGGGAFRGKNQQAVLAGCLFIACRQQKAPRSFAEIMNLTDVPKKEIGRVYKALEKFLVTYHDDRIKKIEAEGGVANASQYGYTSTQSAKPEQLVDRFIGMLDLSARIRVIAHALALQLPTINELAGRSPLSTAGACIYFASHLINKGVSSARLSEVINVSDATIKHAYKFLLAEKDRLIQKDWLGVQELGIRDKGKPGVGSVENLPLS